MTPHNACALRRAGPDDAAALEAFLANYPATSMFLRSNLAAHGTQEDDHTHGTAYYVLDDATGIKAVFGITNGGFLLAQAPDAAQSTWDTFARAIAGRTVIGMTGCPEQVQACLQACGIAKGSFTRLEDEPLYHLKLTDMADVPGEVRLAVPGDQALLETWFATYAWDTGIVSSNDDPSDFAKAMTGRAIEGEDVVILEQGGVCLAMAGINARLPDIVQIGGVFTPQPLRDKGYARRALAGLLRRSAARGVTQSVLHANNQAAARSYEALGYRRIGDYRVALLATPIEIGEAT